MVHVNASLLYGARKALCMWGARGETMVFVCIKRMYDLPSSVLSSILSLLLLFIFGRSEPLHMVHMSSIQR